MPFRILPSRLAFQTPSGRLRFARTSPEGSSRVSPRTTLISEVARVRYIDRGVSDRGTRGFNPSELGTVTGRVAPAGTGVHGVRFFRGPGAPAIYWYNSRSQKGGNDDRSVGHWRTRFSPATPRGRSARRQVSRSRPRSRRALLRSRRLDRRRRRVFGRPLAKKKPLAV